MLTSRALLIEIEAFSAAAGMAPSTVCRKAINDGKLAERLRHGGQVTLKTAERLRAFMEANKTNRPSKRAESRTAA